MKSWSYYTFKMSKSVCERTAVHRLNRGVQVQSKLLVMHNVYAVFNNSKPAPE